MIQKISKTEEIRRRLKAEGKITLLSPTQRAVMEKFDQEMREVQRDFKLKNWKSECSARNLVITD